MATVTTEMPESGWWQVALDIEGEPAVTVEQAATILDGVFPGQPTLALHPSGEGGVWLTELPAEAIDQLTEARFLLVEVGDFGLAAEMF